MHPDCHERRYSVRHLLALGLALTLVLASPRENWAQQPSAGAPTDVRAYPAPAGAVNAIADALRKQYAQSSDVTIIPDASRGQLLVSAPPALHTQIAASLGKLPGAAKPLSPAMSGKSETLRHALSKTTPLELERSLIAAAHGGLRFQRSTVQAIDEAELPTAAGQTVNLKVDHNARTVELTGEPRLAQGWLDVIRSFDQRSPGGEAARLVAVERTEPERLNHALEVIRSIMQANELARTRRQHIGQFVGMVFQQPEQEARQPFPLPRREDQPEAGDMPPPEEQPMPPPAEEEGLGAGPLGNVQIEIVEELGIIIVRGKQKDVDRVMRFIEEIERQSQETQPEIEVLHLKHVDSQALTTLLASVYDQVFAVRQGRVTYTPLVKPNALLLIGRKEAMAPLKELIAKLDQPVAPQQLLRVFPLKFVPAADAQTTIRTFFTNQPPNDTTPLPGLGTRVSVVADTRVNALIVRAGPRDLEEVALLIKQIDVETSAAKDQVRIFKLRNSLADDLSNVLNQAITGQRTGGAGTPPPPGGGAAAPTTGSSTTRSRILEFFIQDGTGRQLLESGVLSDISIVADPRGNSLIVTAPEKSMPLIAELIRQLDDLPAAESQIKVFTIVNGDATSLATMLQQLFGQQQQQANQAAAALFGLSTGGGDSSLVPLRFSVDQRTNSIIASGSAGDLEVVRRILARLDEGDIRERVTKVYRLQNAPSIDVSNAVNQWLQGRQRLSQLETQISSSPFEQIEREVIVVPEPVSNSLIVSATPRYFSEVQKIVEDLDRRPPMVAIQVLIAEVTLNNTDEFGVELGLQDADLFTRGLGVVGFPFNQAAIGNNSDAASLATRNNVATQSLSNFNVGRTNATQGFGGLVLTASSQSVNVLVRALQASERLQIISRPQVQTLDNQPAFVQVGARVPYVTGQTLGTIGTTSSITFQNVGILLGVTPRTSPDGLIVMEINAEKSELGPEATGVPISVTTAGTVRAPQILITTAQTTVSARTGQTVILGGLITKSRDAITRRVPYIADVPVLGRLFRYDQVLDRRTELLIIMTPYVIRKDSDMDALNQRESERMSWCLSDVVNIHGNVNLGAGANPWEESTSPLIYPDESPLGLPAESLPSPGGNAPGVTPGPRTTTTPDVYTPPPTREDPPPPRFQPPQFQPPVAPPPGVETYYQPTPEGTPRPLRPAPGQEFRATPITGNAANPPSSPTSPATPGRPNPTPAAPPSIRQEVPGPPTSRVLPASYPQP